MSETQVLMVVFDFLEFFFLAITSWKRALSVRIHVERAIRRMKTFKLIRNEIPLVSHGSINQSWDSDLLTL